MSSTFSYVDIITLSLYLILVLANGIYFSKSKKGTEEYFLAGRNASWFVVGSSLFITTVSSEHVLGYAEKGYTTGFVEGNYAWLATFILILLSWVFAPVLLKSKAYTMPEYIEMRFGKYTSRIITIFSIFIYVVTKVSVTLFAGALLLESLLGWDKYTSSLLLVVVTGIFTVAGGFRTVLYTGVFHMIILIGAGFVLTIVSINELGGVTELASAGSNHFDLFKANLPNEKIPWTGVLLGAPILGIWYWCTDQYMMQRVLGAKNLSHARSGALFCGFLMILVVFILLVPGIAAKVLHPDLTDAHESYFTLVKNTVPIGLRGIILAGLLSALISSLMASFNSASTLFTLDIYRKLYPKADEFRIVNVGKIATFGVVIFGIIWIPFIDLMNGEDSSIIGYLQTIQSYVAPPLAAIFLFGILWKGTTKLAALTVIISGITFSMFRLYLDIMVDHYENIQFISWLRNINFLHLAFILFCIYSVMLIIISFIDNTSQNSGLGNLVLSKKGNVFISLTDKRTNLSLSLTLALVMLTIWSLFLFY